MSTTLFDGYGRPATYQSTAPTGNRGLYTPAGEDGTRVASPYLDYDISRLLNRYKHRMMLSDCRLIATKMPLVAGALEQKSQYVCQAGFDPVFQGADEAWGEIAREALIEAHQRFDVRGPLWSWHRDWEIACRSIDIDGDFFILFGHDEDGFPQGQFLEAHRIGSRFNEPMVLEGEFANRRLINGIIYDEFGREIGYRILSDLPGEHRDVSAFDMIHCAAPRWFSDGRPFPSVAYSILDWYDAMESRGFQRTKGKINSMLTLVESTPDGRAPNDILLDAARRNALQSTGQLGTDPNNTTADGQPKLLSYLEGGLIRYVKAGQGSIAAHQDSTPGDGWLRFDERIVQGAFYGMGWRAEMLDLSKLSGAPTRGFSDQINTTIYHRWRDLTAFVRRVDLYILARLIANGRVPSHPEWTHWDYVPPAEFTVDTGHATKADLDTIRAGLNTHTSVIGRSGRRARDILVEQAKYQRLKAEVEKEYQLAPGSLGTMDQPGMPMDSDGDGQPDATDPDAQPKPLKKKPLAE